MASICIPVAPKTLDGLEIAFQTALSYTPELIEWRADYLLRPEMNYEQHMALMAQCFEILNRLFSESKPDSNPDSKTKLIFTIRDVKEGGLYPIDDVFKRLWIHAVALKPWLQAVDVELSMSDAFIEDVLIQCHVYGKQVILSHHDFHKMPELEEIVSKAAQGFLSGADIVKIAYTAVNPWDLQILWRATEILSERNIGPIIAVAMGEKGIESRLNPDRYHSMATYASVDVQTAPGQVHIDDIR